ncbi:MAG: hypothetical protein LJE62_12130 [Silicimonas sp.]|jgi:hypothetical protein|nr:hypothetical protein [Silicimonas sp.]
MANQRRPLRNSLSRRQFACHLDQGLIKLALADCQAIPPGKIAKVFYDVEHPIMYHESLIPIG